MELHLLIKDCVDVYGQDIIVSKRLIGLLDDKQAFDEPDTAAYKKILRGLVNDGYVQRFLDLGKYSSEVGMLATNYAQVNLMQEAPVLYVLDCLAFGLGWISQKPVMKTTNSGTASYPPQNLQQNNPPKMGGNNGGGFFSRLFGSKNNNASPSADECYQNAISAKNNGNNNDCIEWLKKAALKGKTDAMFELGEIYTNGGGIDIDVKEAKKWYKMGADKGHTRCMLEYSAACLIEEKYDTALKYAKKPAENQYVNAFAIIGICYFNKGTKSNNEDDMVTAYSWLLKAVSMSNPGGSDPHDISMELYKMALIFTGYCCLSDMGIPRQPQKAKDYIKKAASLGSVEAKDFLTMAEKEHIF